MGRRDKNIAKVQIYGAFRHFIQSGAAKATVSGIVESTGMNRKTFYNHFTSRDELVAWGFRRDLLDVLLLHHEAGELLEPSSDPYGFEGLPCYYRVPSSTFSLDQSSFFRELHETIHAHKDYYRVLLRTEFATPFYQYLVSLFQGLFCEDLDYFLSGRKMPDEAKRFTAAFYAEGVVHYLSDSLSGNLVSRGEIEEISPFNNLVHETMYRLVETYQSEKSNQYFNKTRSL